MALRAVDKKLLILTTALLRDRRNTLTWEFSETLPWIIVRRGERKIAATVRDGVYQTTPLEHIDGLGYLQPLDRSKTIKEAAEAVSIYLERGFDEAFQRMLNSRAVASKNTQGISLEALRKSLRKATRKARTGGKPSSLEFPPSLAKVLEPDPEEIKRLKESIKQEDSADNGYGG